MNKLQKLLSISALSLASVISIPNASAAWIDWTSANSGSLTLGSNTVGVTLTGSPYNYEDGSGYYSNHRTNYTSPDGTYAGLAPSDLIRIVNPTNITLTFDQTVSNLSMALISVGQRSLPVTYTFDSPFTVLSAGDNLWGYSGYDVNGNAFTGYEYNGVLQFAGNFNSISFSISPQENWHAFNFSADSLANSVAEPASLALLGLGLMGLAVARRRVA